MSVDTPATIPLKLVVRRVLSFASELLAFPEFAYIMFSQTSVRPPELASKVIVCTPLLLITGERVRGCCRKTCRVSGNHIPSRQAIDGFAPSGRLLGVSTDREKSEGGKP